MEKFEVLFLEEVFSFLKTLDKQTQMKILENIRLSRISLDPRLFKKLNAHIWEFRTVYASKQIRILAFWDKRKTNRTLVLATHGFIKKSSKIPEGELRRAERIRTTYFKENNNT